MGFDISPMVYHSVQHSGVLAQSLQEKVKELREEMTMKILYYESYIRPECFINIYQRVTNLFFYRQDSTGLTTSPDNYRCILADDMGHSRKGDLFSCKSAGVHVTSKPSSGDSLNLIRKKLEGLSSKRATIPVEDDKPSLEFKQILVPIEEVDSKNEAATLKAYSKCKAISCDQFEAVFRAVELWLVHKAVIPIVNTLGGSIHRNYDLLLRHRLHIVVEVQLAVNHCLLGLPGIVRESTDDTTGAAQFVTLNRLKDIGAIASARAVDIYGLKVLAENIQDAFENITHFLIHARKPIIPKADRPFKTSIVFTLEEGPEVLFKALAIFAMRDINLTKIESRPQRKWPLRVVDDLNARCAKYFDYLFYIDFEASMAKERAQNVLIHLQEFATFMRLLGCYPMDLILWIFYDEGNFE
ncbi:hypothetical protein GIB67_020666 [Kingdonia uniflora]|uniref:arogenate dehydratase n=1 Tax=Kingdonia uniflora TaxID=39325 RepID=A0A7J7M9B8_9MAGN|nr:hypothetical protein GIB67_020666 [Kingdonia uniflora]